MRALGPGYPCSNLAPSLLAGLLLSRFSHVQLCVTQRRQPTRLPRPWDSPGKNTGVGCHFLLQCMKVKSENEVAQSRPTPSNPMDCSLPGSSVHGIFQARVLEWGAIAFSILAGYYQANYFSSLNLSFLTYRTRKIVEPASRGIVRFK